MNWVEEQHFQEIDKIVREICAKMGWSYLDGAKILLAWCKEMESANYDYADKTKELEKVTNYGKIKKNKEITCEVDIFAGLEFDEIKRACDLYARAHTAGKYSGVPADKIKGIDPKAKRVADKYDKEHKDDPDANDVDWTLQFSKHQMNLANVWMEEHRKHCSACKAHDKASKNGIHPCGGWCEFSFDILPTSVATLASIKCNSCGAEYYLDEV